MMTDLRRWVSFGPFGVPLDYSYSKNAGKSTHVLLTELWPLCFNDRQYHHHLMMLYVVPVALCDCGNTEAKNGSEAKCFCRLRRAGAHHGTTTTTCSPVYMCELAVSLDFDLAWLCLLQTTASSSSFILLLLLRFLLFTRREFPFPRREFAANGNLLVASKWLLPDCFDAAVRSSVSGSCFLQLMESEWSVGSAPAANTASHPYLILKLCWITYPYLALGYLTNWCSQ